MADSEADCLSLSLSLSLSLPPYASLTYACALAPGIVVAVLLDEFISTVMKERAESQRFDDDQKRLKVCLSVCLSVCVC